MVDIKKIYYAAVDKCVESGNNMAWLFEKHYAELIIEECAKIAEDAYTRRFPASMYGEFIRQFKRLEP